MSDPAKYRTRDEVQKVKEERDPIDNLRDLLIEKHNITEKKFKDMDKEVKKSIIEAATYATESPDPDISELWTDVYTN